MNNIRKRKGFTLIELLAVIVILAIIAVITVPIILNIIDNTKKSAKIRSTEGIIKSAKNYYAQSLIKGNEVSEKIFLFDDGKSVELEYEGESPESGVLKLDEEGNVGIAVKYDKWCLTKAAKDKNIKVEKYEEGKCLIPDILKDPVISLIGENLIRLRQNNEYIELGVTANTVDGEVLEYTIEIKLNEDIVENIDTSEYGHEYIITYRARSNDKEAITTRTVIIIDGIAPVITLEEYTIINVNDVSDYDLMDGVTATDNSGETLTITYTGSLSTIPGEYEIIYKASDSEGNEVTKVRTIKVEETEAPLLNFSSTSTTKWVKNVTVTVTAVDNNNLSSFNYEIFKNEVSQGINNISVSGKNGSQDITLNTDGIYKIKIAAKDEYNNESSITSGEYKIDVTNPVLNIPEDKTILKNEVQTYNLMSGVNASDNSGITPTLTYTGSLSAIDGNYQITYIATDEAGNETRKTRIITVITKTCSEGELTYDNEKGYICLRQASSYNVCNTCYHSYIDAGYNCNACGKEASGACKWCAFTAYRTAANCEACGGYLSYHCPSGWSNYSGTGSTLKCYRSAS